MISNDAPFRPVLISERASELSNVRVQSRFQIRILYMWLYVNLYAHAREIIAKKTDLLFLSSAVQSAHAQSSLSISRTNKRLTACLYTTHAHDCII